MRKFLALFVISHLDTLPPPDAPLLHCVWTHTTGCVSVVTLLGEVLEQEERYAEAIEFAHADLEEPKNFNAAFKARSGRLLARCHAALGEHSLAAAALDAASQAAKAGELLYAEALTVRQRALVSSSNGGGSVGCWDEATAKRRLHEVMGRMDGGRGGDGGSGERALLEKLLLHGLSWE